MTRTYRLHQICPPPARRIISPVRTANHSQWFVFDGVLARGVYVWERRERKRRPNRCVPSVKERRRSWAEVISATSLYRK